MSRDFATSGVFIDGDFDADIAFSSGGLLLLERDLTGGTTAEYSMEVATSTASAVALTAQSNQDISVSSSTVVGVDFTIPDPPPSSFVASFHTSGLFLVGNEDAPEYHSSGLFVDLPEARTQAEYVMDVVTVTASSVTIGGPTEFNMPVADSTVVGVDISTTISGGTTKQYHSSGLFLDSTALGLQFAAGGLFINEPGLSADVRQFDMEVVTVTCTPIAPDVLQGGIAMDTVDIEVILFDPSYDWEPVIDPGTITLSTVDPSPFKSVASPVDTLTASPVEPTHEWHVNMPVVSVNSLVPDLQFAPTNLDEYEMPVLTSLFSPVDLQTRALIEVSPASALADAITTVPALAARFTVPSVECAVVEIERLEKPYFFVLAGARASGFILAGTRDN